MSRAPNTNGHSAGSVRTRGGYDQYLSPQPNASEASVAEAESDRNRPEPPPDEGGSDAFRYVSGLPTQAAAPPTVGVPGQAQSMSAQQPAPPQSEQPQPAPPHAEQPESEPPEPEQSQSAPPQVGHERAEHQQPVQQQPVQAEPAQPQSAHVRAGQQQPVQGHAAQTQFTEQYRHAHTPAAQQYSAQQPDPQQPVAHTQAWHAQQSAARTTRYSEAVPGPTAAQASTGRPDQGGELDRFDRRTSEVSYPEVLPASLTSMDLLSEISASRRAQLRSTSGMRGALNKVGFNLGLSPAEQRIENRRARIRRQLTATYQIAVVSVKGGVGRTTVAATLGSVFSQLRPDRVVAVDANPDFGDLPTRTTPHPYGLTLRDLVRAPNLEAFSAVHSFTSINTSDLSVLASPWSAESVEALSGAEYGAAISVLRKHYSLVMVDCGTGVLDSVTGAVLQSSDAVVVVTPPTVGGVKGAVATLNWFAAHGLQHLIAASVVAIVQQHTDKPMVEVEQVEKLFSTAQRPTFQLPYDAHLAEGGEIDLRLLDKDTVSAFEELAATLGDGMTGPSAADRGGRL